MFLPALTLLDPTPTGATLAIAPLANAEAWDLSHDGKTLVGTGNERAFAWHLPRENVEAVEIPSAATLAAEEIEILSSPGAALAVSDDGSVIVGNGLQPGPGEFSGGRWIGTILSVMPPVGPRIGGIAAGVSGDGKLVVGSAILNYAAKPRLIKGIGEAAILRISANPQDEGILEGLELGWGSAATAVSRDGTTVVGTLPEPGSGFRWTEAEGALPIGDLPGGGFETAPTAVSEDGTVIVGSAKSQNGIEAFRWTQADGLVGLGDLPGSRFRSLARGVSGDGRIVVGAGTGERRGTSNPGERAFIWDAQNGMRDLWQVLAEQGREGAGLPAKFSRWRLRDAVAVRITPDGHPQIAGTAIDAGGRQVAFVATLGETVAP